MKIENLKLKIVFFGSSKLVIPIIKVLKDHFDLKLVVTTEQNPTDLPANASRKRLQAGAVPTYCIQNNIPYLSIKQLNNETIEQLQSLKTQVAVLADFGLIIPSTLLNIFPKGIINVHPSLLPKFRGPTPVQSAILSGEKETGVSIIRLDEKMDHGPLLAQEKESILDTDTGESLHIRLFQKGAKLLMTIIPFYLSGEQIPIPQDHKKATFTEKLTRNSGYIDLEKLRITNYELRITKMIQAYYPWPGVWTKLRITNKELRIKLLPNKMLQVEGKKPVSYKDFLNGYPEMNEWLNKILNF